jgi:hypothetical protein
MGVDEIAIDQGGCSPMRRTFVSLCAALLATVLAAGTALAAPPSWAAAGGGGGSSSARAAADSGGSGQGGFGNSVSGAVYGALAGGESGTVLAEAVHQVLLSEHADVPGLAVAEAVYARRTSGEPGASAFADLVAQAPWAEGAVDALHAAGVVEGTSSTTFSPDQPVTLAELATMLARLQAGSAPSGAAAPAGTPTWAQGAMAWAEAEGVLEGEQGLAGPTAPLTRAQAVLMLIQAAGLGAQAASLAGAPIPLQGNAPAWAHGALALAIQLGLLQGSGGQLLANQPLTRAQMAVLLARLAVLEAEAGAGTGN